MTTANAAKKKGPSKEELAKLENTIHLELDGGSKVVIELLPDVAPAHVERIKTLSREGFYDGIVFHRVIDGFMVQTGDPTGTGTGSSELEDLPAEFSNVPHDRAVVSMARSASPNSANSQFFIVLEDSHFLDGKYSVFGKVTEGMEYVDQIKKGDARKNGMVDEPDSIVSMKVAADTLEQ